MLLRHSYRKLAIKDMTRSPLLRKEINTLEVQRSGVAFISVPH